MLSLVPGPWGRILLGITAAVGVGLAAHGWSTRHTPAAFGSIGAATRPPAAHPPVAASSSPPAAAGSPATAPGPGTPGPLLASQSFAPYAFLVWPGQLTAAGRAAETGLTITVRRHGAGIEVAAGVSGQPSSPAHYYPAGERVYVIEASLGDDSGNSDYNLGDDGIVVTNAQGRIIQ
jgi:hypothetical protein